MRILAITNLYPNPFEPGRGVFNRLQLRALAETHQVRVISPIAWTDEVVARLKHKGALPRDRRTICDGCVVDHPLYLYPPKVLRSRYGHFYRSSIRRSFARALEEFRPDLVFATWAYPDGWAAADLARAAGLPVVLKVHGCDVLWGLSHHPSKRARTGEALRAADAVIAVSQHLAENILGFGVDPDKVHVVYTGVDAEKFQPGDRAEARRHLGLSDALPLILCVANLYAVKGVDVLFQACAELVRQGLAFRCLVVGDGPSRAQLERQIDTLGLRGTLQLVGSRAHDTLPGWYQAASVVALPSRSEGVPSVLLEAMACGIPFVASRVGGVPEVAHFGRGRLVPPDNADLLAEALREVLCEAHAAPTAPAMVRSQAQVAHELDVILASVCRGRQPVQTSKEPCVAAAGSD